MNEACLNVNLSTSSVVALYAKVLPRETDVVSKTKVRRQILQLCN